MKNNYKKITSLILIILFTVLQFFSSYSYINFFIIPQFYETNDDGILIIKRGKNKKFVDKEGKVLAEVNGEYSYLKKIYDIETKKIKYLVSDNIRYVDEEYHAGYSFYKNEDVKICTLDGIPISEFSEKHFNGDISICFSYKNYLVYVKEWHVLGNGIPNHDTYSYINLFDIEKNEDNKVFDEVLLKEERDDWRYGYASGIGNIEHIHFDADNSLLKIYIKTGDYKNNKDEYIKGREIGLSFNPLTKEVSKIDYVPYGKEEKEEKNINPAFSSNIFALWDDNAKRNEMYSDKLKKLNIENYVDFSVDGDKIYVMAFTDKINRNLLLEEYRYDVYDEDGKIILKDLPICKKHTIIHMHVNYDDYWIKDLNTYSDEHSEHHWCIEGVAKMQMKNRYYYAYNKGLYDLKSYNGKVIFDNIDDYTVDGKFYDIYCFKKDGIWYLYDAFSNEIFAKNFDPNYVSWDILNLGEEKFIRFTMDDDKMALYDKDGKILMKNLVKCEPSNNKYFQVENAFNYGFIDKNGEWVVKYPAFDVIDD